MEQPSPVERIPCPADICGTAACPVFETEGRCYEDIHHKIYPRRLIRRMGKIAMRFRELDENKEQRCRASHNELHATQPLPELPTKPEMAEAVRLALDPAEGAA